jgi:hypothetical protein
MSEDFRDLPEFNASILKNATVGRDLTTGPITITQNFNNNPAQSPPAVGIPQNLPRSGVVQFVGRQTKIEELHEKLQQNERLAITAVKGMGGYW